MSETIIQPIDKNGVLGPQILIKKSILQKLWETWFNIVKNSLAIIGLIWLISWFF